MGKMRGMRGDAIGIGVVILLSASSSVTELRRVVLKKPRKVRECPSHNMSNRATYLTNKCEHVAGDVTLSKACTGIREEIVPLAFERVVVSSVPQGGVVFGDYVLCKIGVEPSAPFTERAGVVWEKVIT
jgi:hypothetical protein